MYTSQFKEKLTLKTGFVIQGHICELSIAYLLNGFISTCRFLVRFLFNYSLYDLNIITYYLQIIICNHINLPTHMFVLEK